MYSDENEAKIHPRSYELKSPKGFYSMKDSKLWCFAKMNQDEINKAEWENPDNWSLGSKWLRVYFSRKDSRTWVPKQTPWMGSTLNLGKSAGVAWLVGFLLGIPALILLITITIFILGFGT